MSRRSLCTTDNLFDFFHEQVGTAVLSTRAPVSEESVFYLANLLVERGVDRRPEGRAEPVPDTLAELHIQASTGTRTEAIRSYRELGDKALYTSGFFRGSITRRSVGVDYYMDMGAAAYQRLAILLRAPKGMVIGEVGGRGLDEVYAELAGCFELCSEVLCEVRETIRSQSDDISDASVLRLYEEWINTGSRRAAARLKELGVIPMRPSTSGEGEPGC